MVDGRPVGILIRNPKDPRVEKKVFSPSTREGTSNETPITFKFTFYRIMSNLHFYGEFVIHKSLTGRQKKRGEPRRSDTN